MADLLVVDDNPDLAEALELVLLDYGHEVRVARNGMHGLELVRARRPDLVLLDVEMPVLDGPGMAYGMLLANSGLERIPIVLMSAIMDLHLVAARVGTPYFVGKPYSLDTFLPLLDRALAERCAPHPQRPDDAFEGELERISQSP
jgi:CheY-like chemotaxis protein